MDMLKGPVRKTLLSFSIPIILSMFVQQFYGVVDAMIVGRFLGPGQLSAVGNGANILSLLSIVAYGIELGSGVAFAESFGRGDHHSIRKGTAQLMLFALTFAAASSILFYFIQKPIFTLLHLQKDLFTDTGAYFSVCLIGQIFVFGLSVSNAVLLALGKSRINMLVSIVSSALNILLDLLLVGPLHMGTAGAAAATVIAQGTGFAVSAFFLYGALRKLPGGHEPLSVKQNFLMHALGYACASMLQQLALNLAALILQGLVNELGSDCSAGYTAVNRVIAMTNMPAVGFCQALCIFASANRAAGSKERILTAYRHAVLLAEICMAVIAAVFVFLPGQVMGLFIDRDSAEAFSFGTFLLSHLAVSQFVSGLQFQNDSLLRGLGRMKSYMVSCFAAAGIRTVFSWGFFTQLGRHVFWAGDLLGRLSSVILTFILLYRLYRIFRQRPDTDNAET